MESALTAIELTGTVDEHQQLHLDTALRSTVLNGFELLCCTRRLMTTMRRNGCRQRRITQPLRT